MNRLWHFDVASGHEQKRINIEADNPTNRSNDGRADPYCGFWIGSTDKNAEPNEGAIYRYYLGGLRTLAQNVTITDSICFAPDDRLAYYADAQRAIIWSVTLDGRGWPSAGPEIFLEYSDEGLHPDVSAVDSEVALWNAQ